MKKRTSKEIFAETLMEIAANKPLDKVTVKEIVEESGLSLQTFYNHFADKYDLILWVQQSAAARFRERIEREGVGYRQVLLDHIGFYLEHKDFLLNAWKNTHGDDSFAQQTAASAYEAWTEFLLQAKGVEELPEEIAFDLRMFCVASAYMMAEWAFSTGGIDAEQFADYLLGGMPPKLLAFFDE